MRDVSLWFGRFGAVITIAVFVQAAKGCAPGGQGGDEPSYYQTQMKDCVTSCAERCSYARYDVAFTAVEDHHSSCVCACRPPAEHGHEREPLP